MITQNVGDVTVLKMIDRVDSVTSRSVETELQQLVSSGTRKMVCDFTGTQYISSAGLRVVLGIMKILKREGGQLRLVCPKSGYVYEVLETSGFTGIMSVHPTASDAVQQMQ